jgi:hypothetical protein
MRIDVIIESCEGKVADYLGQQPSLSYDEDVLWTGLERRFATDRFNKLAELDVMQHDSTMGYREYADKMLRVASGVKIP